MSAALPSAELASARAWVRATIEALARHSATAAGTTRLAFSPEFEAARDLVLSPFRDDPEVEVSFDAVDNTFVRYAAGHPPEVPVGLLVGSHLDSVRAGGGLDGVLGVVAGAALLRLLRAARVPLAAPVGLVIFSDEEGGRFGNGTFGSRALAGRLGPEELELVEPETGRRLADYLAALPVRPRPGYPSAPAGRGADGCAPGDPLAVRLPWPVRAFVEPHIEQGPRLERAGVRVGVVTEIVGIRRFRIVSEGEANHAGTTAMADRADALVPVARIAAALPALVADMFPAVITAGELRVEPNAMNVIPGRAVLGVECRAPGCLPDRPESPRSGASQGGSEGPSAPLDRIVARLERLVADVQAGSRARLTVQRLRASDPAPMAPEVQAAIRRAAAALGEPSIDLVSLAGHDAMNMAALCPTGMFFVPSLGGISHSPQEASRPEDLELAFDLLLATAAELGVIPAAAASGIVRRSGSR